VSGSQPKRRIDSHEISGDYFSDYLEFAFPGLGLGIVVPRWVAGPVSRRSRPIASVYSTVIDFARSFARTNSALQCRRNSRRRLKYDCAR